LTGGYHQQDKALAIEEAYWLSAVNQTLNIRHLNP
jgi:hypothetical protein